MRVYQEDIKLLVQSSPDREGDRTGVFQRLLLAGYARCWVNGLEGEIENRMMVSRFWGIKIVDRGSQRANPAVRLLLHRQSAP